MRHSNEWSHPSCLVIASLANQWVTFPIGDSSLIIHSAPSARFIQDSSPFCCWHATRLRTQMFNLNSTDMPPPVNRLVGEGVGRRRKRKIESHAEARRKEEKFDISGFSHAIPPSAEKKKKAEWDIGRKVFP
ncbi:hypothetical protein CEXT_772601 [Caerostris extrusa]|uniref:Uncharacterized protein n=1 Tax=Caerostris extrusa TaxID=172846 RepID=A0AAV4NPV8_CAEEX|nr:hypothetical protein CEXT_772601 [Caerostris extrusa]